MKGMHHDWPPNMHPLCVRVACTEAPAVPQLLNNLVNPMLTDMYQVPPCLYRNPQHKGFGA